MSSFWTCTIVKASELCAYKLNSDFLGFEFFGFGHQDVWGMCKGSENCLFFRDSLIPIYLFILALHGRQIGVLRAGMNYANQQQNAKKIKEEKVGFLSCFSSSSFGILFTSVSKQCNDSQSL